MTREEAIKWLQNEKTEHINTHGVRYFTRTEAIDMGIQALEAIDAIRAEIERKANSGQWSEAVRYGMAKALMIIDKHIGEVSNDE